jgi:hypothetical protein
MKTPCSTVSPLYMQCILSRTELEYQCLRCDDRGRVRRAYLEDPAQHCINQCAQTQATVTKGEGCVRADSIISV